MLPALGACSEKYLTYNHTPGEKPDEPDDPDDPMPETMPKGSFKLLADKPGQVIKGLGTTTTARSECRWTWCQRSVNVLPRRC